MKKFMFALMLFILYIGALVVYIPSTFIIVMSKWADWISSELNAILKM